MANMFILRNIYSSVGLWVKKFPEIYSNLSGNLLITYVNQLFPRPALQSDAVK